MDETESEYQTKNAKAKFEKNSSNRKSHQNSQINFTDFLSILKYILMHQILSEICYLVKKSGNKGP